MHVLTGKIQVVLFNMKPGLRHRNGLLKVFKCDYLEHEDNTQSKIITRRQIDLRKIFLSAKYIRHSRGDQSRLKAVRTPVISIPTSRFYGNVRRYMVFQNV